MSTIDPADYIGRQERRQDVVDSGRIAGLAALLDHDGSHWTPGMLPPLGHWLCFLPDARQSALGPDGHPRLDPEGLLPPSDLPRRMWAGSRVRFLADLPLGTRIERVSTLVAATPKTGRSGRMILATVRHQISSVGGALAIEEEQDIVYREAATPGVILPRASVPTGTPHEVTRTVMPDTVALFRYSALTYNAHRIHYDRPYAREVEGYPALVVHGPLLATLLLDHLLRCQPERKPATFAFRAIAPSFDGDAITLGYTGDVESIKLRADNAMGPAMEAVATVTG